jgi:hypothetical protein
MRRSIDDARPDRNATAGPPVDVIDVPRQGRLPRWLLALGFWTLIVLAYSTRTEIRAGSYTWVRISWLDSAKLAATQWYPWALLSVGIYWVNRILPFRSDALLRRLLVHIPLSVVFGVAYTYLNYALTQLLNAPTETVWLGATVLSIGWAPSSTGRSP